MAIPPTEKTRQESSFQLTAPAASAISTSAPFHSLIEEQISRNAKNREIKIQKLPRNSQELIFSFFKDLANIEALFLELKKITPPGMTATPPSSQEKESYHKIRKEFQDKLEKLEQIYKKDGFESLFLTTLLRSPESDPLDVRFSIEKTKNRFFSNVLYKQEVTQFIEQHKIAILADFFPVGISKFDLQSINFSLESLGSETHHQGRTPTLITFIHDNVTLFKIVYKPRSAAIDKAVMDTFFHLNQLQPEHRSSTALLPFYKIVNFENFSLWEFIDGKDIINERSAGFFIRSNLEGGRRDKAEKYLDRMDAILSKMGISDLHRENVKILNFLDKDKDIEIVPIDLENRQKGQSTQLGGHPKNVTLTPQEEQTIDKFFESLTYDIPCRYLPLSTLLMLSMIGEYRECEELTRRLLKQIESDKFSIEISLIDLQRLILTSMIYHDVPYFTEYKNVIYYGLPNERQPIAKRGK